MARILREGVPENNCLKVSSGLWVETPRRQVCQEAPAGLTAPVGFLGGREKAARELGIRLALGAQRGDVLRLILQQGAWLVAAGLALGLAAALALTRVLQSQLYGIRATDPLTFGAMALRRRRWPCWRAGYPRAAPRGLTRWPRSVVSDCDHRRGRKKRHCVKVCG